MDAARRAGVTKFVGIGTTCSYPAAADIPLREEQFWDGAPDEANAPYGHAKRMLVAQASAYARQYGFRAIHLIPTNLYGPRDHFDLQTSHVIPALIRKFAEASGNGAREVVWGDGTSRGSSFVETRRADPGRERYESLVPVNLGTGVETSIRETTERLAPCGLRAPLLGHRPAQRRGPPLPDASCAR